MKPDTYDRNWFGFIKCKVIPPRGLYLPILPYKQRCKQNAHKLLFGLCRTCMARINAKCTHFNGKVKCDKNCTAIACSKCRLIEN